jgi:hypothetical protein
VSSSDSINWGVGAQHTEAKARIAQERYRERSTVKQARQRLQRQQLLQASAAGDLASGADAGVTCSAACSAASALHMLDRRPRSVSLLDADKPPVEEGEEEGGAANSKSHKLNRRSSRSLSLAEPLQPTNVIGR